MLQSFSENFNNILYTYLLNIFPQSVYKVENIEMDSFILTNTSWTQLLKIYIATLLFYKPTDFLLKLTTYLYNMPARKLRICFKVLKYPPVEYCLVAF